MRRSWTLSINSCTNSFTRNLRLVPLVKNTRLPRLNCTKCTWQLTDLMLRNFRSLILWSILAWSLRIERLSLTWWSPTVITQVLAKRYSVKSPPYSCWNCTNTWIGQIRSFTQSSSSSLKIKLKKTYFMILKRLMAPELKQVPPKRVPQVKTKAKIRPKLAKLRMIKSQVAS